MKTTLLSLIPLSILAISCSDATDQPNAQAEETAVLTGYVSDGEAVAARTVVAYNAEGAVVAETSTNETGAYTLNLPAVELPVLIEVDLNASPIALGRVLAEAEPSGEVLRAVVVETEQACVDSACVAHINPVSEVVAEALLAQTQLGELTRVMLQTKGDSLVQAMFGVDMDVSAFLQDRNFRPSLAVGDSALRNAGVAQEPNAAGLLLQALKGQALQQGTSVTEALKQSSGLMQDTAFVGKLFQYSLAQGADTTALQEQVQNWYGEDAEAIEVMEQMWEEVRSEEAAGEEPSSGETDGVKPEESGDTGEAAQEPSGDGSVEEPVGDGSAEEPVGDGSDVEVDPVQDGEMSQP